MSSGSTGICLCLRSPSLLVSCVDAYLRWPFGLDWRWSLKPQLVHRTTMSASKKRKTSGLSGLKLDLTLTQLRKLRSSKRCRSPNPAPAGTFADQLDSMIATLGSRVNNLGRYFLTSFAMPPFSWSLSFSAANYKVLERFNIVRKGLLYLHPEATE